MLVVSQHSALIIHFVWWITGLKRLGQAIVKKVQPMIEKLPWLEETKPATPDAAAQPTEQGAGPKLVPL